MAQAYRTGCRQIIPGDFAGPGGSHLRVALSVAGVERAPPAVGGQSQTSDSPMGFRGGDEVRLIPNAGCLKRCQRVSATRPRTIIDRGARLDTRCEIFPKRALP